MTNANPYLPPAADLADEPGVHGDGLAATRGQRLKAAVVDGVINAILIFPMMYVFGALDFAKRAQTPFLFMLGMMVVGFLIFILVHGHFLKRDGQTLGKKIVGIKIVDLDNGVPRFSRIIFARYLPVSAVALIPVAGNLLPLVDSLFIFRSDRRCIHDLIAGTKVVQAMKRA
jgi:uncharacterized RDD family membrane protein YckC